MISITIIPTIIMQYVIIPLSIYFFYYYYYYYFIITVIIIIIFIMIPCGRTSLQGKEMGVSVCWYTKASKLAGGR